MPIQRFHSTKVLRRRVETLANHLAAVVPTQVELLDVGCGDGQIARLLLDRRPDLRLTGVDVLVRPQTAIAVRAYDGTTLPFADASVDFVMLIDVLHHAADPRALLREAVRVSRRGIVLKDHNRNGWFADSTLRLMDWVGNAHHGVTIRYEYWSAHDWRQVFAEQQLEPVHTVTALGIYPAWADWLFGRQLHFLTLLEKSRRP